jgi:hypothetical protein
VWFDEHERIVGFQLCYEIEKEPKALTWLEKEGFIHTGIDDGDNVGWIKATPILIRDGVFDKMTIERRFATSSQGLPEEIAGFVKSKLAEYKPEKG